MRFTADVPVQSPAVDEDSASEQLTEAQGPEHSQGPGVDHVARLTLETVSSRADSMELWKLLA